MLCISNRVGRKKIAETQQTFKDVSCNKKKGKTLKKERYFKLAILLYYYYLFYD